MKAQRVAIYCRVSTTDQTVENQKHDLTRYCEARAMKVVGVFEDIGVSGAQSSRPAVDALMNAARRREFDVVLVWRFDRFARSTQHLLQALQEFRELGIDFVSNSEGIDTSTSVGKMVFTFLSAIAEFERDIIRERVRAGIARAKAEGKHCGRPRKGIDLARAVELRRQGLGYKQIAKALGIPRSTLHSYLRNLPILPVQKTPGEDEA